MNNSLQNAYYHKHVGDLSNAFDVLCPGQTATSAPATWPVQLWLCIPFASMSLAASPHASIPVDYNGHTAGERFVISAVAPAVYLPVVFMPDVRSAQIPLLYLNQMSFFSMLSPLEMRIWNYRLKQSLHLLFTNHSVHILPFIAERVSGEEAEHQAAQCGIFYFSFKSVSVSFLPLLPTSLKIFELEGLLKFLCLFMLSNKGWAAKIHSFNPWDFLHLGLVLKEQMEVP